MTFGASLVGPRQLPDALVCTRLEAGGVLGHVEVGEPDEALRVKPFGGGEGYSHHFGTAHLVISHRFSV